MIKTEKEYRGTLERIAQEQELIIKQRQALQEEGYSSEQIEQILEPTLTFHMQFTDEAYWYERVRAGDVAPIDNLTNIGQVLIGLRIARGLTQTALAERLGVSEAVVCRDENNDYHGISVAKAQRILDALEGQTTLVVAKAPRKSPIRDLVAA
jgi:DNA-binding XRE family transcriptional regulator